MGLQKERILCKISFFHFIRQIYTVNKNFKIVIIWLHNTHEEKVNSQRLNASTFKKKEFIRS
jgi:hypothetical protein